MASCILLCQLLASGSRRRHPCCLWLPERFPPESERTAGYARTVEKLCRCFRSAFLHSLHIHGYIFTVSNKYVGDVDHKPDSHCYWLSSQQQSFVAFAYYAAQSYEQFLQVGRLYQAFILRSLALCLPRAA